MPRRHFTLFLLKDSVTTGDDALRPRRPREPAPLRRELTAAAGIDVEFIDEVEKMMKPGSSALFVLDDVGDMEIILHEIQGLGGTVLKTNVDQERAKLIQSTLAAHSGKD